MCFKELLFAVLITLIYLSCQFYIFQNNKYFIDQDSIDHYINDLKFNFTIEKLDQIREDAFNNPPSMLYLFYESISCFIFTLILSILLCNCCCKNEKIKI